jgi:hypothetical protein
MGSRTFTISTSPCSLRIEEEALSHAVAACGFGTRSISCVLNRLEAILMEAEFGLVQFQGLVACPDCSDLARIRRAGQSVRRDLAMAVTEAEALAASARRGALRRASLLARALRNAADDLEVIAIDEAAGTDQIRALRIGTEVEGIAGRLAGARRKPRCSS